MKVVIVGGGASGMMAAIECAKQNIDVVIIEKTQSLGNKLKITGKGRCNITFDGDRETFKENVVKNYKFLYSAFSSFTNKDTIEFFYNLGVKTKVERGGRVFPVSDNAEDIVEVLKAEIKRLNVKIMYNESVECIIQKDAKLEGVKLKSGKKILCDRCIIATGGKSYTVTGSTGDGYLISKKVGHTIEEVIPGLVPLKSNDKVCKELQGLSLKNVGLKLYDSEKEIYFGFGEMMFAHFGITGPLVLSASSKLNRVDNLQEKLKEGKIYASIDLKPALDFEKLDKRICRDFAAYSNKEFKNSLDDLLPKKIIPIVIALSGIKEDEKVHQIKKEQRQNLVKILKEFKIAITNLMPIDMAVITCGGINVKEINPKNMKSKIINGLAFAGEVLDVDAYTGGFNLQIAFSTAYLAAKYIKEE